MSTSRRHRFVTPRAKHMSDPFAVRSGLAFAMVLLAGYGVATLQAWAIAPAAMALALTPSK
jgi:hypothetical protein